MRACCCSLLLPRRPGCCLQRLDGATARAVGGRQSGGKIPACGPSAPLACPPAALSAALPAAARDLAISGAAATHAMQVAGLEEGLEVCVFDNRGVGRSSAPEARSAYSTSLMAADTLALMDELGWSSAHIVGEAPFAMLCLLCPRSPLLAASLCHPGNLKPRQPQPNPTPPRPHPPSPYPNPIPPIHSGGHSNHPRALRERPSHPSARFTWAARRHAAMPPPCRHAAMLPQASPWAAWWP